MARRIAAGRRARPAGGRATITDDKASARISEELAGAIQKVVQAKLRVARIVARAPGADLATVIAGLHPDYQAEIPLILAAFDTLITDHGPQADAE